MTREYMYGNMCECGSVVVFHVRGKVYAVVGCHGGGEEWREEGRGEERREERRRGEEERRGEDQRRGEEREEERRRSEDLN